MNVKFLNATLVTCDKSRRTLRSAGLAVKGDKIVGVGDSEEVDRAWPDLPAIDVRGKALLPGIINAHTHLLLLALRGTVEDMSSEVIYRYMTPISFAMNADEREAIGRLACLEAIRSGTTTLVEPFRHLTTYAQALADTGMRIYLAESCTDVLTLKLRSGKYEFDRAWGEAFLDRARALIEQFHNTHQGRVRCQISAHAPDNCSPWMLAQLNDLAQKHNLRRTVHLAQSRGEVAQVKSYAGCTPAEYLEQNDWLGPDVVGAHWTYCTQEDVTLLAKHSVHMAHCPANSSRRGPHQAPIAAIMEAGVNIALATDNMTEDMFQAMTIGSIVHRGGRGGGIRPGPQEMLDGATRNGALSLGRLDELGSLEVGKKADITLIDLDNPSLRPAINLVSNIVHYGHPGIVDSVMVDGEFVMRDRKVLCMNEREVVQAAQVAVEGAWRRLREQAPDIPMPESLRAG